jgi:hypothetical protein
VVRYPEPIRWKTLLRCLRRHNELALQRGIPHDRGLTGNNVALVSSEYRSMRAELPAQAVELVDAFRSRSGSDRPRKPDAWNAVPKALRADGCDVVTPHQKLGDGNDPNSGLHGPGLGP